MTLTQTVEITANRRTVEVPREIPSGPTIIAFTPAPKRKLTAEEEREFINANAERFRQQSEDTFEFLADVYTAHLKGRKQESGS